MRNKSEGADDDGSCGIGRRTLSSIAYLFYNSHFTAFVIRSTCSSLLHLCFLFLFFFTIQYLCTLQLYCSQSLSRSQSEPLPRIRITGLLDREQAPRRLSGYCPPHTTRNITISAVHHTPSSSSSTLELSSYETLLAFILVTQTHCLIGSIFNRTFNNNNLFLYTNHQNIIPTTPVVVHFHVFLPIWPSGTAQSQLPAKTVSWRFGCRPEVVVVAAAATAAGATLGKSFSFRPHNKSSPDNSESSRIRSTDLVAENCWFCVGDNTFGAMLARIAYPWHSYTTDIQDRTSK